MTNEEVDKKSTAPKDKAAKRPVVADSGNSFFNVLIIGLFGIFLSLLFLNFASDYRPITYEVHAPLKFEGHLAPNTKLQNAELLLKDQHVEGPESILVEGDTIITAVEDGRILKVQKGKIVKEIILVKDKLCKTTESRLQNPHKCGRPLGMRRLNKDVIVFADAYLGILALDVEKGLVEVVLKGDAMIDGKPFRFADDLDLLDDHTVIVSDASTVWYHNEVPYDFIEQKPNGRVIKVDLKTGKAETLVDKLVFPNGIQVHPDKESVLIDETWRYKITRYYFKGPKKGKSETFIELPGAPDNIRLNSRGNFWVAMAFVRHPEKFWLWDFLAPYPAVRKFITQVIPFPYIGQFHLATLHKYGMIVEVDQQGKIVQSLHDPTGIVREISQVEEDDKHLYIASYHMPYIAKVKK